MTMAACGDRLAESRMTSTQRLAVRAKNLQARPARSVDTVCRCAFLRCGAIWGAILGQAVCHGHQAFQYLVARYAMNSNTTMNLKSQPYHNSILRC
jgi:hypothetical protein